MADALMITIADKVLAVLNEAVLSQSFTAVRALLPEYGRVEMATLHVTVVPRRKTTTLMTRGVAAQRLCEIDVAVQKACKPADATTTDPLLYLLDEIEALFFGKQLTGYTAASCHQSDHLEGAEAGYAPEHLKKLDQFTGVLRLTFRVVE